MQRLGNDGTVFLCPFLGVCCHDSIRGKYRQGERDLMLCAVALIGMRGAGVVIASDSRPGLLLWSWDECCMVCEELPFYVDSTLSLSAPYDVDDAVNSCGA